MGTYRGVTGGLFCRCRLDMQFCFVLVKALSAPADPPMSLRRMACIVRCRVFQEQWSTLTTSKPKPAPAFDAANAVCQRWILDTNLRLPTDGEVQRKLDSLGCEERVDERLAKMDSLTCDERVDKGPTKMDSLSCDKRVDKKLAKMDSLSCDKRVAKRPARDSLS